MSIDRRPYAPPADPDEVAEDTAFEMDADRELDFSEDPYRDLFDEQDLVVDEDEFDIEGDY